MIKYRSPKIIVKSLLVVIAVFCSVTIIKLQFDYNSLVDREAELRAKRDAIAADVAELQAKLDTPFDEDYVIGVAHEKLNLRLPEEIIFYNDLTQ